MTSHPLDRPVWRALTTRQAALSRGEGRARRYAPDYGLFAATQDVSPSSLEALAALCPPGGGLALFEVDERSAPPGMAVIERGVCVQMIADAVTPRDLALAIRPLTEDDATRMLALATLTNPGPFFSRTHQMGDFIGVERGGALAAMAGERMKLPGFTEVSAVCTHPSHRGRGYAGGLTAAVAERILARGETPFLHVLAHNTAAIGLYQALGFRPRRAMALTVVGRPAA